VSPNDADMKNNKFNSSAKGLFRSSALLFFLMDGAVFRGGNTLAKHTGRTALLPFQMR
jgi:hypothetical protein